MVFSSLSENQDAELAVYELPKMALMDLPGKTRAGVAKEREEPFPDFTTIPSSKRHLSERPLGPLHSSASCSSPNGHLVYVRRKVEDSGRGGTRDMEMGPSAKSAISHRDKRKGLSAEQDHWQEPKSSYFQSFSSLTAASSRGTLVTCALGKPTTGFSSKELTCPMGSTGGPAQAQPTCPSRAHWKERFLRLQTFLRSCDQADQEEYIQSKSFQVPSASRFSNADLNFCLNGGSASASISILSRQG